MKNNLTNTNWEKYGSIGILTISNPPDNLISDPSFASTDYLKEILSDPDLKSMIIRGEGRHFSAGADMEKLKEMAGNREFLSSKMAAGKDTIRFIENIHIPVVAEISGVCFGAGLEIALSCHIRILSEKAMLAFPETNHGIMPGMGGSVLLSKLLGTGRAAEIILSGNIINATKALELGLADHVVPKKELHNFTIDFLKILTADRDINVITSVMKSIQNAQSMPFEKALEEETRLFCDLAVKSMQDHDHHL